MAITEQITCDVCGKQKADVNHWWMFRSGQNNPTLLSAAVSFPIMQLAMWSEAAHGEFCHACGQECLIKAVSSWMQEKGSDKP